MKKALGGGLVLLLFCAPPASAQSLRALINGGNDLYEEGRFADAERSYRKALERENTLVQGRFNLGDALARQGRHDEAIREFEAAAQTAAEPRTRAHAWHNIGNSFMEQQKYREAAGAYSEALKRNPHDMETKYNLSYALRRMQTQAGNPEQQEGGGESRQGEKDRQEGQKQDQGGKEPEEGGGSEERDGRSPGEQAGEREQSISRKDAERILEVLKNSERDVQKKIRARKAVRARSEKDW
ncbi:MAG: tetratricopeptide repeat protein [Bacteroidota bacterium]